MADERSRSGIPLRFQPYVNVVSQPPRPWGCGRQRYLHPDMTQITNAGNSLTAHLNPIRTPLTLAMQRTPGHRR